MTTDTGTSSDITDALFLKEVRDAYFDLDKADIRPDAREALSHTAEFLRNYPQLKVTIEGHCDERGSTEYNLVLGDRRATAVKQYLVSQGISADRLGTVSFGKEKPFCTESTEECWQKNRRGPFREDQLVAAALVPNAPNFRTESSGRFQCRKILRPRITLARSQRSRYSRIRNQPSTTQHGARSATSHRALLRRKLHART